MTITQKMQRLSGCVNQSRKISRHIYLNTCQYFERHIIFSKKGICEKLSISFVKYSPTLANLNQIFVKSFEFSDCNGTRTRNHKFRKRTLNPLAKLVKWLSSVMSTYLYGAFGCMLLSCHVRLSDWIHTL